MNFWADREQRGMLFIPFVQIVWVTHEYIYFYTIHVYVLYMTLLYMF